MVGLSKIMPFLHEKVPLEPKHGQIAVLMSFTPLFAVLFGRNVELI